MSNTTRRWKKVGHPYFVFDCIHNTAWVSRDRSWVRVDLTGDATSNSVPYLTDRAASVLGPNGVDRFAEFSSYQNGWDFGNGTALNSESVARMEEFLSHFSGFERRPSLFLTQVGNLMLGWEDTYGSPVEIEFAPNAYRLYLGSADDDREFRADQLSDFLREIAKVSANGSP